MKIITIPSSLDEVKKTLYLVDAYIIGIKNMSVNANMYVSLNELKSIDELLKKEKKEFFVFLNKNMHNSDLDELKHILLELNNYHIKGVLYYDVALISLKNKLKLNYDLVWASEHLTTNYNTVNYWYDFNVRYTLISGEVTKNEILNIKKHTKSKLIVPIFGYLPMYVSKRHGVKNYLNYFNITDQSKINYLEKENIFYPVIDNEIGTYMYSGNVLNGLSEVLDFKKADVDYLLFNSFNIEEDLFIRVLNIYINVSKSTLIKDEKAINKMFKNIDKGFLYTETITKVKNNDK